MPILDASTGSDFKREHIPPNTYRATLTGIKAGQIPDMDRPGEKKNVMFWSFEIPGKVKNVSVEGMTTTAFYGDRAKARKWARALMNIEPPITMDTDDLVGMSCRVVVVDKTQGTPPETFSRVENVISAEEGEL